MKKLNLFLIITFTMVCSFSHADTCTQLQLSAGCHNNHHNGHDIYTTCYCEQNPCEHGKVFQSDYFNFPANGNQELDKSLREHAQSYCSKMIEPLRAFQSSETQYGYNFDQYPTSYFAQACFFCAQTASP